MNEKAFNALTATVRRVLAQFEPDLSLTQDGAVRERLLYRARLVDAIVAFCKKHAGEFDAVRFRKACYYADCPHPVRGGLPTRWHVENHPRICGGR